MPPTRKRSIHSQPKCREASRTPNMSRSLPAALAPLPAQGAPHDGPSATGALAYQGFRPRGISEVPRQVSLATKRAEPSTMSRTKPTMAGPPC
eukprot:8329608-Pyramimonas_sp.AAC.1